MWLIRKVKTWVSTSLTAKNTYIDAFRLETGPFVLTHIDIFIFVLTCIQPTRTNRLNSFTRCVNVRFFKAKFNYSFLVDEIVICFIFLK